ncbi:MAG: beta-N-acetylglucosaminidase, partial [Bacteroidetes bacterium]
LVSVFIMSSITSKATNIDDEKIPIIPKPLHLKVLKGFFTITDKTKIISSKELLGTANYLSGLLSKSLDGKIKIIDDKLSSANNISLIIDKDISGDEEYNLLIENNKIIISGKTAQGIFYGIQTLRQMLPSSIESGQIKLAKIQINNVKINDKPRFKYRGMLLDVGRHLFSVDFIKKYIDLIAMHKMNVLHWHLTEDQGWRIEIKKHPKLIEIGAYRDETIIGKQTKTNQNYDGKPYGGYYSQEEIKEIVAYAQERFVDIIPEIEMPGHSLAALASYPELGCENKNYKVATRWGVFKDVYCPSEKTFKFLEDVIDEVVELFPGKYIHVGGDECPKDTWKESKLAQDLIKKKGLKNEEELQSYFITRMEKYINSKGKQIIGWAEILEGGLAPNAAVMSWRGESGGIEAAEQNHYVVMTPGSHCYFDYYQSKKKDKEPLAIGGYIPVKKVYSYNPIPKGLNKDKTKYILGAQGNLWTEYISTPEQVEYMVLPRMSALSEVLWTPEENKNWKDFKNRMDIFRKRYDALGLNYAKHMF